MTYLVFPVIDMCAPEDPDKARWLVENIAQQYLMGQNILVHCRYAFNFVYHNYKPICRAANGTFPFHFVTHYKVFSLWMSTVNWCAGQALAVLAWYVRVSF